MPIPNYQAIMLPLLQFAGDKKEHSLREVITHLTKIFNLTNDEIKELLPSGKQSRFVNRIGWARTHLKKAVLIKYSRRGFFEITDRGVQLLLDNPSNLNVNFLKKYDEYLEFCQIKNNSSNIIIKDTDNNISNTQLLDTPEEALENAHQQLQETLAIEILENIKQCSPNFFESLVVDLLVSMGYGGSRKEAGQALRRSRDEGIDGIIVTTQVV